MASSLAIVLSGNIALNISPRSLEELYQKWLTTTVNAHNTSDLVKIFFRTYDNMVPSSLLEETELFILKVTILLDEYVHAAVYLQLELWS